MSRRDRRAGTQRERAVRVALKRIESVFVEEIVKKPELQEDKDQYNGILTRANNLYNKVIKENERATNLFKQYYNYMALKYKFGFKVKLKEAVNGN